MELIRVLTKEREEVDFAIYVDIDDSALFELERDPSIINDKEFISRLPFKRGPHAHIIQLTLRGKVKTRKYIEDLLLRYATVSWVRKDKLYIHKNKEGLYGFYSNSGGLNLQCCQNK